MTRAYKMTHVDSINNTLQTGLHMANVNNR